MPKKLGIGPGLYGKSVLYLLGMSWYKHPTFLTFIIMKCSWLFHQFPILFADYWLSHHMFSPIFLTNLFQEIHQYFSVLRSQKRKQISYWIFWQQRICGCLFCKSQIHMLWKQFITFWKYFSLLHLLLSQVYSVSVFSTKKYLLSHKNSEKRVEMGNFFGVAHNNFRGQ